MAEKLPAGATVAFDGNLASLQVAQVVQQTLEPLGIRVNGQADLLSPLWTDRPSLPLAPAYLLEEEITGQSTASKLEAVRKALQKTEQNIIWFHRLTIWPGCLMFVVRMYLAIR